MLKGKMLSALPELLKMDDGAPVTDRESWRARRGELLKTVIDMEYGGMPPEPKTLRVEELSITPPGGINCYRIVADGYPFYLRIYKPSLPFRPPYPAVLYGDGCWKYMNDAFIAEVNRRGFALAVFDRLELASDVKDSGRSAGIYALYPEREFGALSAWAWGYLRAMDALERIDLIDDSRVGITGHSRGGKTVLLAGAVDERFAFVNPNNSGAGGCGCYRFHTESDTPGGGGEMRSETLRDLLNNFDFWFGREMQKYADDEASLPFDQHMMKALVAPRVLLQTEALNDIWANAKGTYLTHEAAKAVYRLLGAENNIILRYREGNHRHDLNALCAFLDCMEGKTLADNTPEWVKSI